MPEETHSDRLREALAHAISSPQLAGDPDLVDLLTKLTEAELNDTPPDLGAHSDRQLQRLRKRLYEYRESHPSRRFHIYVPREGIRPILRTPGLRRESQQSSTKLLAWLAIPAALVFLGLAGLIWYRLSMQEESAIFRFAGDGALQSFSVAADESFFIYASQPDPTQPAALYRASFANPEGTRLSADKRHASHPALSPDGQKLAYWRRDSDAAYSLVLRSLSSSEERLLLSLPEAQPLAWNSGAAALLTTAARQLISVDLASGKTTPLLADPLPTVADSHPLPRPQHSELAFLRQVDRGAASIQILAGGQSVALVEGLYQFRGHAWSPNGQYLYFAAEYQGERGLWRCNRDSKLVERARVGGQNSHSPVVAQRIFWLDEAIERKLSAWDPATKRWSDVALAQTPLAAPVFSRDGTQWAMRVQEAGRSTFLLHPRQYTLSLSDLDVRGSAVWTLDSRNLIFPARRTGRASLYIQALEGGLPKLLTSCPAEASSPRFSPDGRWLAFLCGAELYKLPWPSDGRDPQRISLDAWRSLEYDAVTNSVLACALDFRRARVDLERNVVERLPASLEFLDPPYLASSRREYFFASPLGTLRRQTDRFAAFRPLTESAAPAADTDRALSVAPDGSIVYLHSRKLSNLGIQGIRLPAAESAR